MSERFCTFASEIKRYNPKTRNTMKKTIILSVMLIMAIMANAQTKMLKQSGITAEEMVPNGWKLLASAENDINHDYIPDLVVIALPDFPENIQTREDGYQINKNSPIVAIYFGEGGVYKLWNSAISIIESADEFSSLDEVSASISAKGVVTIGYKMFYSAGSWGVPTNKFVYRYQNHDLFLIGYDRITLNRATLEEETVSYNFLTHKKQTSITKNGAKIKKDKWQNIAKKPLMEFGPDPLDYIYD